MQRHHEPARTDLERVQALLRSPGVSGNARLNLIELEQRLKAGFLPSESRQRIRDLYKRQVDQAGATQTGGQAAGPRRPDSQIDLGKKGPGFEAETARLRLRVAQLERQLAQKAEASEPGQNQNLMIRLETAEKDARTARQAASRLEESLADIRSKANRSANAKVRRIKRVFAQRFHPDQISTSGLDREIRETVFKEFWRELDRIEREEAV